MMGKMTREQLEQRLLDFGIQRSPLSVPTATVTDDDVVCQFCGKHLVGKRSDAKFCNATCRKRNGRRKSKMKRVKQNAITNINEIKRMMDKYDDLSTFGALLLEEISSKCDSRRRDG